MHRIKIRNNIFWMGAIDWDRRLFDSLIPLPDGTSYNAYLLQGTDKTALLDSVDPKFEKIFMKKLSGITTIDYVVAHHAEQDHSGSIPFVLDKFPLAKVVTTPKGKELLIDHLSIEEERFITVTDGEEISLGDISLRFIYTPWVHWPETMCTYVPEEKILFSCDFFGAHIASTDLFVNDQPRVYEAAKRYYAEIMMPFRTIIKKNLEKLRPLDITMIAPSHGQIYGEPEFIINAYKDWISDTPKNLAVIPFISMHESTRAMVEFLVTSLAERGVHVQQFDLSVTDLGKLAIALVDAATIIIGTPTVQITPHPAVVYASYLANALRPKVKFASIIGSYGWSTRAVEKIAELIPNLNVELVEPVLCKGYPRKVTFDALETLAETIAQKHREAGIL